ncbi:relaxosome protein TraM [Pantoea agglomerans]|uniref:relaxosome protein TraM n=1 Tax=Enterobacter agglomerans TaxID=549 RepID=UPI00289B960E|nr:relaxosome protein TraM [Pantoea agglomerans]WNK42247.1 relaxosome protein TraM [Pantoea agglomerans]WNK51202.1 relaxosome protein TraM [Pantoea agglomerans]
MSEDNSGKRNRVNLTIPFSLLEKIDAHVEKKLEDGESRDTANRSAFVMEMFKLGLRVYENKINKDASEKTLDQKLEFIAKNVLVSGFITDAIFGIQKETVDPGRVIKNEMVLDPEWVKAVNERVAGKLQEYFK